jgi:biopolymer transport protein TolR
MSLFDGSNNGKRKARAELNITPMVDIVFVLLIIFMVAAPMIEQGVDLDLPETETVPIESPKDKFIVRLIKGRKKGDNEIYIGKVEVPINKLELKLKHNENLKKKGEIFLHAEKTLPYGYVVRVMAIAKKAGIKNISLVTEPLDGDS